MNVLYLEGDACSVKYVRSALAIRGHGVDLLTPRAPSLAETDADVVLVSDFAGAGIALHERAILDALDRGAGLVTVGGWQSYGRGGWHRTRLAERLPVLVRDEDDRHACMQGARLRPVGEPELARGLPWDEPFVVCGWNALHPRSEATVVLEGIEPERESAPALVASGSGRVLCLATDLAPHWSGSWTDWGSPPVRGEEGEELGAAYVDFVDELVTWAGGGRPRASVPQRSKPTG